ncbi:MAG: YHS domain-containing protein [Spirochaetota bacterium]
MTLTVAIALSAFVALVSAAVGVYLHRYRGSVTEMLGMMIGMTFGMMTGIALGYFIGVATDMFISNLVAVTIGVLYGVVFGRVGGLMGMMDGGMGGMMGGMMGAMLGVMVNLSPTTVWVTAALMMLLFLLSMVALIRLVQTGAARIYALDPVCGMAVDTATTKLASDYNGLTVYFCAPGCKRAFDAAPEKFIAFANK